MNKTLILKNDLCEIQSITDAVADFGVEKKISDKVICDCILALEEVFSNIVHYAYRDECEHQIEIQINLSAEELVLEIRDDGKPFNPLEIPEPDIAKPFEEREIGGLGIHLVRNSMDQLDYSFKQGKNILTMKKRFRQ